MMRTFICKATWTSLAVAASVGAIGAGLWSLTPSASAGAPPVGDGTPYEPVESITYEFGSKYMSGYFVQDSSQCRLTMMVIERSDPESSEDLPTAVRVRLNLRPGQVAGLDSQEGPALNLTCGRDATSVVVHTGERDKLAALQRLALSKDSPQSR